MHLISESIFRDFYRKHPDSKEPIRKFIRTVKKANWKTLSDIKKDYNSADYLGNDRYCFNIKGNDYRVIVLIFFRSSKVYVRFIGTHKEYERLSNASSV